MPTETPTKNRPKKSENTNRIKASDRRLLDRLTLAEKLDVHVRTVENMNCRGELPEPVRLGRAIRWDSEVIDLWISLGCPSRQRFEELQAAAAKKQTQSARVGRER